MKILFYKSRHLLIPICIHSLAFCGIAIHILLRQVDENVKEFLSLRIIDSIELLRNAQEDVKVVRATYQRGALAQCRAIALAVDLNRGEKDMPLIIAKLAKTMSVEMYAVSNEKGIIELSNELPAIGYDLNSREQSRQFLTLLKNPNSVVVQKPMPRGLDEAMFQYIGIARHDRKGIVQIGYSLKNYGSIESTLSLRRRMQAMRIGERGFILVVRNNRIIAAEDSSVLHKELRQIGIAKLGDAGDFFHVKLHGRKYIASYESMDDIILIGMIPESEIFNLARSCIFLIIFLQASLLALICFILYNNRLHASQELSQDH